MPGQKNWVSSEDQRRSNKERKLRKEIKMLKKALFAIVVVALVAVGAQADVDDFTGTTSSSASSSWTVTSDVPKTVCDFDIYMKVVRLAVITECNDIILEQVGDDYIGCCDIAGSINFQPATITLTVADVGAIPNQGWDTQIDDTNCGSGPEGTWAGGLTATDTLTVIYNNSACIREACVKLLDPNVHEVAANPSLLVGTGTVTISP
jgi:hypothetical protein